MKLNYKHVGIGLNTASLQPGFGNFRHIGSYETTDQFMWKQLPHSLKIYSQIVPKKS